MNDDQTNTGLAEPPVAERGAHASNTTVAAASRATTEPSKAIETRAHPPAGPPKTIWREYFESAVVTVIMALFGMTFIVQAVVVPTGSMQNTILIGDHLLVNKFIFAPGKTLPFLPQREIRRGDIIVFKYPGNKLDPQKDMERSQPSPPYTTNFVKRVIGLPGDLIEVHDERVFINGQPLPERRIAARNYADDLSTPESEDSKPLEILNAPPLAPTDAYTVYTDSDAQQDSSYKFGLKGKPVRVPADSYFAMGDNRDNSEDSRFWGFVQRDLIIGRAMFVYWSSGNILLDFLRNTRWRRTGTMIK